jgi:hypothetical protein
MTLVGSWPYIGLCRIGRGKTAHYGTFRTIIAGRDDLGVMVEPFGRLGLLPGVVKAIPARRPYRTIVAQDASHRQHNI